MSLSCTVSEIQQNTGRKLPIVTYPPLCGNPVGVTPLELGLALLI